MTMMGEALDEREIQYMLQLATEEGSSDEHLIDIERLTRVLIPSDNIIDDLRKHIEANKEIEPIAETSEDISNVELKNDSIDTKNLP